MDAGGLRLEKISTEWPVHGHVYGYVAELKETARLPPYQQIPTFSSNEHGRLGVSLPWSL